MSSRCLNHKSNKYFSLAQKSSYSVFSRYSFLVSCVASSASRRCMQVQWTNLYNDCAAKPWCEARTIPQIHSNFDSILIPGVINSSLLNFVSSIQQQPTTNTGSPSNPAIKDVSWYIIYSWQVVQIGWQSAGIHKDKILCWMTGCTWSPMVFSFQLVWQRSAGTLAREKYCTMSRNVWF